MTMLQKILIDRLLGTPIAYMLNGMARVLGLILSRDHSMTDKNVRCLAVAKFAGLGSILQATPLIRTLRQNAPGARILLLTSEANRGLAERLEGVDQVLCIDDRGILRIALTTAHALVRLWLLRVDLYIDLEVYSAYASSIAILSMARNRFGFYRSSTLFKKGIYTHLLYFNTRKPVRHLYLQMGAIAGMNSVTNTDRLGPIRVHEHERDALRTKLGHMGVVPSELDEPYVVVNANASDLMIERRWPAASFVNVIDRIARPNRRVFLTGSAGEAEYVDRLFRDLSHDTVRFVTNVAGKLNLGEYLALMEHAGCVLTNDSGPLHVALALGRPLVALFGPADPAHYGILTDVTRYFYFPVICSPCLYEVDRPPCNGNNVCMGLIHPDPVVEAVEDLLADAPRGDEACLSVFSCHVRSIAQNTEGEPLGLVTRHSLRPACKRRTPEQVHEDHS